MDSIHNEKILNKYIIEQKLGQGASAGVYLARHKMMGNLCAIKCIPKNNEYYDRLSKEATLMRGLKHESIPVIYDIDEDDEEIYIIEEYCRGKTVREIMGEKETDRLKLLSVIVLKLSEVLNYLHSKGILYVDLKPDNIIICDENNLKIIDFGSAVRFEKTVEERDYFASKAYASPELLKGRGVDLRSDIYSFGKLIERFLSCLCSDDTKRKDEELIRHFKRISGKCTGSLKFLRYRDFNEVIKDIRRFNTKQENRSQNEVSFAWSKDVTSEVCTICVAESMRGTGATFWSMMLAEFLIESGRRAVCVDAALYDRMNEKADRDYVYIINCLDEFENWKQLIWGCDHLICLLRSDGLIAGMEKNKKLLELTDICESRIAAYNMADKLLTGNKNKSGIIRLPYISGIGFEEEKPSHLSEETRNCIRRLMGSEG